MQSTLHIIIVFQIWAVIIVHFAIFHQQNINLVLLLHLNKQFYSFNVELQNNFCLNAAVNSIEWWGKYLQLTRQLRYFFKKKKVDHSFYKRFMFEIFCCKFIVVSKIKKAIHNSYGKNRVYVSAFSVYINVVFNWTILKWKKVPQSFIIKFHL